MKVPQLKKAQTVEMHCIVCWTINEVPKKDHDRERYGRCRNPDCLASDLGY